MKNCPHVSAPYAFPVRSRRFDEGRLVLVCGRGGRRAFPARSLPVERLELIEVHALDVAADAPFGERQRHPRLEPLDDPRRQRRVGVEKVIQAAGPGVHQLFQPVGARLVLRSHIVGIDEQLHSQVPVHLGLAFGFCQAAHGVEIVRLDAIEVVFGLDVGHAEDSIGIGPSVNMRDAPGVADDRDVAGLSLPAGNVLVFVRGSRRGAGSAYRGDNNHELLHGCLHLLSATRARRRA